MLQISGLAEAVKDSPEVAPADDAEQSVMEHSTCSDNSYVKCELPTSSLNRVDSSNDCNRGAASEFR